MPWAGTTSRTCTWGASAESETASAGTTADSGKRQATIRRRMRMSIRTNPLLDAIDGHLVADCCTAAKLTSSSSLLYLRELAASLTVRNELFAFPVGPVSQIACIVEIGQNHASQCEDI